MPSGANRDRLVFVNGAISASISLAVCVRPEESPESFGRAKGDPRSKAIRARQKILRGRAPMRPPRPQSVRARSAADSRSRSWRAFLVGRENTGPVSTGRSVRAGRTLHRGRRRRSRDDGRDHRRPPMPFADDFISSIIADASLIVRSPAVSTPKRCRSSPAKSTRCRSAITCSARA
jgi:hypothetical protein